MMLLGLVLPLALLRLQPPVSCCHAVIKAANGDIMLLARGLRAVFKGLRRNLLVNIAVPKNFLRLLKQEESTKFQPPEKAAYCPLIGGCCC